MVTKTLRELHEAATPAPWSAIPRSRGPRGRLITAFVNAPQDRYTTHGRMVAALADDSSDHGEYINPGTFRPDADAALIAAMRNALPLLLDVVDAARAYRYAKDGHNDLTAHDHSLCLETAAAQLSFALAALDGAA